MHAFEESYVVMSDTFSVIRVFSLMHLAFLFHFDINIRN